MEDELVTLKRELKCWESMFARKYGRRPVKEDIDQSSAEIKDSYKRYAVLKSGKSKDVNDAVKSVHKLPKAVDDTATSVHKLPKEAKDDDGVFSLSLNKKPKKTPEKISHFKKDSSGWRPKLKVMKRNTESIEEKITDVKESIEDVENDNGLSNVSISSPAVDMLSPANRKVIGSVRKKSASTARFKHVSQDLLNTCKDYLNRFDDTPLKKDNIDPVSKENFGVTDPSLPPDISSKHLENDNVLKERDVASNSFNSPDSSSIAEMSKRDTTVTPVRNDCLKLNNSGVVENNKDKRSVTSNLFSTDSKNNDFCANTVANDAESAKTTLPQLKCDANIKHDNIVKDNKRNVSSHVHIDKKENKSSFGHRVDNGPCDDGDDDIPLSKVKIQPNKNGGNISVDFIVDSAENALSKPLKKRVTRKTNIKSDPDFDFTDEVDEQDQSISKTRKTRSVKKCGKNKECDELIQGEDSSDEGLTTKTKRKREPKDEKNTKVKRRKKSETDPEFSLVEKDTDDTVCEEKESKDTKETKETDKKTKKVPVKKSTAKTNKLVSDNFVKIDIRKKTYVRGIKKLTGAQMKRREWKKKTAFERPIKTSKTGKTICFKCGGDGHWAKHCKEQFKKKVNPFDKIDEERSSLDFEHMIGGERNPFSVDNSNDNRRNTGRTYNADFTMDDVLKIEPCWPRIPYNTSVPQDADTMPLYEPDNGKPSAESYKKVTSCLKTFGYETFREGQREATARIVSGLSTLVILSTGSGKSLCYQLPAYLFYKEKKWITIVVSPLIALMQDQVAGLPACLPGACLNGNMTKLQQQRVITKLKEGKLAVLLVSPETLVSGGFGYGMLPPKFTLPPIAFACIDEAHCLSEWSHNFRPSYLKVCKVLQERYNIKCLLGLTATASLATAKSVVHHLGIKCEGSIIRDPHPVPQNLHITASRDINRDQALIELLQISPFSTCDSIIVYTTRRTETERLAGKLRTCLPDYTPAEKDEDEKAEEKKKQKKIKSTARKKAKPFWWNVDCYHAGLTPAERKRIQNDFMNGELRIVVATVAFGMGLDKADVRSVIHYNMPKSFENYVQEIGRAGRDGKPAYCHVFLSEESGDLNEIRRHIYSDGVDRRTLDTFIDLAFPQCRCLEINKKHSATKDEGEGNNEHLVELPQAGSYKWEDTMQSLSDDEMELLFSEHFDNECKANVEGMESHTSDFCNDGHDDEDNAMDSITCEENPVINETCEENPVIDETCEDATVENIAHEKDTAVTIATDECSAVTNVTCNDPAVTDVTKNALNKCDLSEQNTSEYEAMSVDNDKMASQPSDRSSSDDKNCVGAVSPADNHVEAEDKNLNYCSGHRICLCIDDTVAALDMPEENIATLMSYLELHPKKYLDVLNPMRAFCSVKCYGGTEQFQLLAKKFHPIAIAVRYCINDDPHQLRNRRGIDFNFAEIADIMCWDVITVAREVRSLQWNMDFALDRELNVNGKSGIIVECENLSFHFVTTDGIDDDGRDEICDFLHQSVLKQEETRLLQLDALYTSLRKLSCEYYWQIKPDIRVDEHIRQCIFEYFMSDEVGQLGILKEMCGTKVKEVVPERKWNAIANDIRTIIVAHPDQTFTGRAIARIFHGIGSPCFPAINYGRDRRFWRAYLDVDFNELRIYASKIVHRLKGIHTKL